MKLSLKGVLTERHSLLPTQRDYVWSVGTDGKEVDRFWEDLLKFHQARKIDPSKGYCLGLAIFYESNGISYIVDGQQRITTSTIFLAACRDQCAYIEELGENMDYIRTTISGLIGAVDPEDPTEEGEIHLTVKDVNKPFFRNIIMGCDPEWDGVEPFGAKNMHAAYNYFCKTLSKHLRVQPTTKDMRMELKSLIQTLTEGMEMIPVTEKTLEGAKQTFETTNNRGKALSQTDILKNYVLSLANPDDDMSNPYARMWAKMEEDMPPRLFEDMTYKYWASHKEMHSVKSLANSVMKSITDQPSAENFINHIYNLYPHYLHTIDTDWSVPPQTKGSPSARAIIEDVLFDLCSMNSKIHIPIYMAMVDKDYAPTDMASVLLDLRKLTVRFIVLERAGRQFDSLIKKTCRAIQDSLYPSKVISDFRTTVRELMPTDAEFEAALAQHDFKTNDVPKVILKGIAIPEDTEYTFKKTIHLEHICPKKPDFQNGKWSSFRTCHTQYVYKLGNMTLLTGGGNLKIGNKEFQTKKETYADSSVEMTRRLCDYSDWHPSDITERTADLIPLIIRAW